MTTFARITVKAAVGVGLCATAVTAAVALSPLAAALPFKTGGYKCVDAAAGVPGVPCAAPAVEAAGVVPAAAPAAVPPVPVAPPPVAPPPIGVPPVPLAPPVPVVPVVPAGAPVAAAPAPVAAPVAVAAGAPSGKGVPTVSPGGGPGAGTPTLPGPVDGAAG
ncbi:hypothetical protein A5746_00565 [Mycolicibacterium conceptionense]|uniref:hypothetical protein n=1 Tax=Mycolicibacterium conceptionense TaxID=451644 RepID=UPI0007EBC11D|nr:hypothetical protein [Mycolicibacterium conceptionense]OBF43433.1 hypothetical protein A5720_12425 [Mycolicibacterium conceptionense]OBH96819.1 hypothetical protein A5716_00930 [Mycolicibacterium conceptionense]OMB99669.1 hypothetical protein A5746_00565 [Mycolicibacterium conceptionense]